MLFTVDWFNLMAYDFHGGWDSVTGPHTALRSSDGLNTEHALELYFAAGVPPSKIVCGLALYGRAWTVSSSSGSMEYGMRTSGLAKAGPCTQEAGVLNQLEISTLVGSNFKVDKETQTVIGWSGDQFVTFENEETLGAKIDYFHELGLGGVMTWAMSMDVDYKLMKHVYDKAISTTTDSSSSSSDQSSSDCRDVVQCGQDMLSCVKQADETEICSCSDSWSKCLSKKECDS